MADSFDAKSLSRTGDSVSKCLDGLKKEYGDMRYGKEKFSPEEMYWIGYIHRFFCLSYGVSSLEAFKILKAAVLRKVFYPYHSLDCADAIERMLESRGRTLDQKELEEKVKSIYRRMLKEEVRNKRFAREATARKKQANAR